jgi:hypothetical protein
VSKPSFDFLSAPKQQLRAADTDQRDLGLQPDQAAEAWRMGEEQGLQPDMAIRNAGDVRAEAERQRLDRLADESPVLASWLTAKPERLAIARDDLEELSTFEKVFRNLVPSDMGTRYVDTTARAPVAGFTGYFGQALTGLGDLNDAAARSLDRAARSAFGPELPGDNLQLPWWLNPSELARQPGQTLRDAGTAIGVPKERQNFATDVTGGVGQLGGMSLQSVAAPQTLLPALFGVGASQQADAARAAGVEGTAGADAAVMLGAPITAALERFGLEKLLNRLPPKIKSNTARWLADKGIAFLYEGGQEVVEGVAQDTLAKATFDPERQVGAGLAYEGTVAGTSAALVRTMLGVRSPMRPVVESADDVARVEQLHTLGAALKTLDRNPAEVEALVRSMVDRSPNAATHVYLDAEQLVSYFQTANLDPAAEIAKLTGDPNGVQLAAAAGGDIVVPIERYVARAVKSPHADALKGMARLRADGASNAELERLDMDALFAEIAPDTTAAAERADPNAAPSPDPVAEVAGAVRVQLEAAGVESSAATAQANLLAQRYATRAARRGLGETALQVYEAAQLAIRSATPGDVQRRTRPGAVESATDSVLDALRTQTYPSNWDTFGPSLVEALGRRGGIRDEAMAGEIRSLTESDGERFKALLAEVGGKRPKSSKRAKDFKPLTPADAKMTLDDAVVAAQESGYLREGEGINELLDALQDELVADKPRYSDQYRNPDLQALREAMRSLDEVLSEQGIDLQTLSNAEVRAALTRAYEQSGPISDEDRAAQIRGRRVLRGITRDSTAAEIDKSLTAVEGLKTRLRDLPPAGAPVSAANPDPGTTSAVGAFWGALAGAEGIFSYPLPAEGVKDIQEIADAVELGFKISQSAEDSDGVIRFNVTTPLGKSGRFELEPGGQLQLHIGDFDQGSAEGQKFYAIFNTWAARNGLKAVPDRQGLTPVNKYRRTENMLSSALRDGQTTHLSPADIQGLPHWREGDFGAEPTAQDQTFNVGYLALKSAETAFNSVPLLDRVRFDFKARRFVDSKGREFTDADFDTLSSQLQAGKIGVGRRSLKRAAVTESALREIHGSGLDSDRAAELGLAARASVGSELQGDDAPGVLDRILYQPGGRQDLNQDPAAGGVSASGVQADALTDEEIYDLLEEYGRTVDAMADAEKAWTEGDLVFINNEMADGEPYLAESLQQIRNAVTDAMMVVRREDFEASNGRTLNQPADGNRNAPRGRIVLGANGARTIELLEGADLSTFHHETGHLFLDELIEDAFTEGTPDGLRADLDLLLGWWGLETRTADGKAAVMAAIKVDQHETFARGYEAYLFEGKAPAPGLADLMARFRTWMIAVYRQIAALNVNLSDEVRGVYARLLATDDQVAAAEQSAGYVPLEIPADVQGILPAGQWAKYQDMLAAATVEARQAVEQRLLAAQQREAKAWWRDRRAEMRETVLAEGQSRRDFVAVSVLSRGKMPDGSEPPEGLAGLSLSRERLVDLYGEAFVKDTLGPRKVFRKTGGTTPLAASALLGFADGGALVDAIANAPKLKEWVEAETDARMREQYPDPLLDGSLPAAAMDAVHNNKRLRALEYELNLLAVVARQPPIKARVLGAAARQRIAGMKRRDIRANDYLVAERKAARLATKAAAAGNYAEALRRKREQALSAHLYRAAQDATAEFDTARDYLRKFTRTDARARLGKAGGSYLEQIDALLELVEVRAVSGRDVDRRQALAEWVAARAAAGESIDVPDAVLALTRVTNLRDMPMEQIRGLVDTIKQIDHLARLKTELMLGKERRDRAEVDAEMAASVRAARAGRPENKGDRTLAERAREAVNSGLGAYLRPSTLARDLDGFEDSGAVWTHTVGVIQDAIGNELNPALQAAQEALADIWRAHYTDAELRKMDTAIGRGAVGSWSKGRILSLALNWGNEGNREALLSQARKRLAPEQIGELINTLDARDVDFLNAVWAHVDSYWPAIAEAQKRRTGLVPEKVEASPFTIRIDGQDAQLRGGYFPLKYEAEGDPKASQDEQTEFWDAIRTGRFAKAQTKNGHTKERVGSGGRTVRLDIGVLGSHVRDVLRDVHLGDAVNYVHKTLQGTEFRGALAEVDKLEYAKALDLWLRDVATGEMVPRTFFERTGRKLRTNFTASLLGFNVSSALVQPTGFLQSGAALGWGTMATGLKRLLSSPWVGPNSVGVAVDRLSPTMAARAQQSVESVRKVEKALAGKRDGYVLRHAWVMMAKTQRIVDLATWLGAEAKGLDLFDGDVKRARAYADDAVQRSQASGEFSDKSALERGTFGENIRQAELLRGTTALMSYMIAKGNVVYERTRQTNFKDPGQVGLLAVNLTSLLVIENLMIAALRGGLPSDEDEDGNLLDDAALWFFREGALGLLGTIPIMSQAATSLRGYDPQGTVERMAKTGQRLTDALMDWGFEDEPLTASDAKAAVSLIGMLTGLPASQINRTLEAVLANQNGEDIAAHEFLLGRRKE